MLNLIGWGNWDRTSGMPESKSGALPLGDIPMLTPPREPDEGEKENGVDEGIRTLDLQSHNLTP